MVPEGRAKPVTFNQSVPIKGQDSIQQTLDHYIEQSKNTLKLINLLHFDFYIYIALLICCCLVNQRSPWFPWLPAEMSHVHLYLLVFNFNFKILNIQVKGHHKTQSEQCENWTFLGSCL